MIAASMIALIVSALAGCTSQPASGRATTSTMTTVPGAPTTTLPSSMYVDGTTATGTNSFLGSARRVPVTAIPAGASSAPLPEPGQSDYLSLERLAYRRFGSGPDLLLVMGQDGSMTWWAPPFLALLAQHYRVTIFDLPGIGYSPPPRGPLTLDVMADDTAGLIASLGLSSPTVLGWGLGGAVAMALAERHPASVGALVLADAFAGGPGATPPSPTMQRRWASVWATPNSLAGAIFSAVHHLERGAWLLGFSTVPPDAVTQAAIAADGRLVASLQRGRALLASLAAIRVPTLVVDGTADRVVAPGNSTAIAGAILGSTQIVYPGADYGAIFEMQSSFVASLLQFTS